MADFEVLHTRSANIQDCYIPKPPHFTLWPRIYLRSALTSTPTKIAGKKASLRASSIGTIRDPTPGTVLCRYCHLSWRDIPKPAYVDWVYHLAILARVRTPWAHASTLGRTYSSMSSLGPR